MGIKIIRHGSVDTVTRWFIYYKRKTPDNTGYAFPCTEDGELLLDQMSTLDMMIYDACEFGEYSDQVELVGYLRDSELVRTYAVGKCICGEEISLQSMKNKCPNCSVVYTQLGTQE